MSNGFLCVQWHPHLPIPCQETYIRRTRHIRQVVPREMDPKAKKLGDVFRAASREGVLEGPFRQVVEKHLIELAQELGIDLVPRTEVTLGTSRRADTIYNRFIVEWEKPGSFRASNEALKNTQSIA